METYVAPKHYHVRYTSEIITGLEFFDNLDLNHPLDANLSDPHHVPVEIKLESFATLIEALRRTADVIEELETPHHGWVEIMIYYFDVEDESSTHESYFLYFQHNPEIGLTWT